MFGITGTLSPSYGRESVSGVVRQNVGTFSDDIFWNKGKHAFKFGTLINKFGQGLTDNFFTSGSLGFNNLAQFSFCRRLCIRPRLRPRTQM